MIFILLSLTRPVIQNSLNDEKFNSQEYIIALDASFSMQAQDLQPTRYEVAKKAIKKLLLNHPNDKFSIFVFTSNALLISPPTTDSNFSFLALNALNPKYILTKSTSIKTLFKTIAKSSFNQKKLLIFTDGGEEYRIEPLLKILNDADITAYIIATASHKGSALKKDGYLIKDQYSSIVISRINPILKILAQKSGGKYYELTSDKLNIIDNLSNDIDVQNNKDTTIKVQSYKELYYYPLIIAIVFFLFATTKIHQLYLFIPILFIPHNVHAGLFDFYYLHNAQNYYTQKEYIKAAKEFKKLSPSVESYLNIASSYYKAKHYKTALEYFSVIKSPKPEVKQQCFYAMGNIAVKLKRYDRAKNYYLQALALGEDEDTLYNLNLLHKLQLKTDTNLIDMLPEKNPHIKNNSSKSTSQQKDTKKQSKANKKSNQSAQNSSATATNSKKNKNKQNNEQNNNLSVKKNDTYKMGYKSYEIINKGYTNEQNPW
jgi:Ca-activated chloride channel family protein